MTTNQSPELAQAIQTALRITEKPVVCSPGKVFRKSRPRVSTDEEIRDLGTEKKGYKTFVTQVPDLYVYTTTHGAKSFRFNYQDANGAHKTHTFGKFGQWTLGMAVAAYDDARKALLRGECPRAMQLQEREQTMGTLADEFAKWFPRYKGTVCEAYAARTLAVFESDEMKPLRGKRLAAINSAMVLQFGQAVEVSRSKSFARECVLLMEKLYKHAKLHLRACGDNPAVGIVEHLTPRDSQPFEALQLEQLPLYFQDLDRLTTVGTVKAQTVLALRILPYITVRPDILRWAEWSWIHMDGVPGVKGCKGPTLRVPAFTPGTKQRQTEKRADQRGKSYVPYLVPLSTQVVALLAQLRELTGTGKYLFPGYKSKTSTGERPISEGRWLNALRSAGWDGTTAERGAITVHGFRALFATSAYERYVISGHEKHALEFQQDHKLTEGVRANYTHDKHGSHRQLLVPQRAQLLQWWANEIDMVLACGGEIPTSRADLAAEYASRHYDNASPRVMRG